MKRLRDYVNQKTVLSSKNFNKEQNTDNGSVSKDLSRRDQHASKMDQRHGIISIDCSKHNSLNQTKKTLA